MKRNHLSFFLAPRIPFAAADLVADARARTEINSRFGASAGRADARRRDEGDVGHRRGAATTPIRALRRRAPPGCGPRACSKMQIYFCASPKVADVRSGRAGKDGACEPTCSASRFGVQPSGFIDSVQAKPELRTGF